ncbi:glycosyltransferase family 4 protein [Candidatus Aerophobetes bacterium]|nr:glycosyltransferase family 4 protein [Candidatus Aerophobetes bacterium]
MPVRNYDLLKNKTLALFFTFNVSLKTWHDVGMINREVTLYNKLSNYLKHIYFFTYGGKEDLKFKNYLSENITILPVPFIHTSRSPKWFLPLMLAYSFLLPFIHYKILKNVDILKTNQMSGSWSAVIAKILLRKKLIVRTGYTWSLFVGRNNPKSWKKKIVKAIERFSYYFADGVIVSSNNDLEYLRNNYRLNGYQIIIPNYIDTDVFKPLNIQKKKGSICFVGRLDKQKNLFSLLEAMVGLPYTLTIVGSGPLRENLEKYAKEKELNVEFLGNIPNSELPKILNQHEIFILPSLYEGMPKALLEAMACGLPVIGTNVEGIKEVIKHEENGYLCETDANSIKEAIRKVLDNKKLQEKIGKNARQTIVNNFSLKNILKKEIIIYEAL